MDSYSEMSSKLDQLVNSMQNEDLDIDEATKKYHEATKLLKEMQKYLDKAESKIKEIGS